MGNNRKPQLGGILTRTSWVLYVRMYLLFLSLLIVFSFKSIKVFTLCFVAPKITPLVSAKIFAVLALGLFSYSHFN